MRVLLGGAGGQVGLGGAAASMAGYGRELIAYDRAGLDISGWRCLQAASPRDRARHRR